ncbi:succinate dehydrogenase cytochrome b subunit [Candidatus Symbiothrix dinenymphae]|uniref:succinate dehydrogenase cytochrome b subunit n=1 Tax=Candidatus Symbiothrix dinenymphae TaxID=467085 RepID=UPI0006BFEBB5|nr:succinate dehydrogenase cytochrome b subunit [Candidatus Symbiothrix dinenymphae]GAP72574.1 succinate dehydrogenase cytochrome b subunit [Candidatus Symbiothrix dinenymphae]
MYWLFNSSIGRKFIMSITGTCLVLFLLFHMSMNLVLVFSTEAYDMICEFLGANWYAVVATLALAGGFAIHILYGTALTLQNKFARGSQGYTSGNNTKTEWSAKNMYVLGLFILLGLAVHLCNFWYKMQFAELIGSPDAVKAGSGLVIALFSNAVYVVIYLLWLWALWFHLTHGVWSAFQTLGWNNKTWYKRVHFIAYIVATVIAIGFAICPVYFGLQSLLNGTMTIV